MRVIVWIAIFFGISVVVMLYAAALIKSFLGRYSMIDGPGTMTEFKAVVKKLMYLALGQIVIMSPVVVLGFYAGAARKFTPNEFVIFLLLMGSGIALGYWVKKFEKQATSLPVNTDYPGLEEEYKAVCHTWMKKPLPNF